VPGSHKWGNHITYLQATPEEKFHYLGDDFAPPADAEINCVERVPWPVRRGEVSFHHSMTWHGSGENRSNRPRRAIAIHFMTNETRFVASGQHVMKRFVKLGDGEPMARAGEHFPPVCRDGRPVGVPTRLTPATA
jgi:phytanoyl-CoA hydroxylase